MLKQTEWEGQKSGEQIVCDEYACVQDKRRRADKKEEEEEKDEEWRVRMRKRKGQSWNQWWMVIISSLTELYHNDLTIIAYASHCFCTLARSVFFTSKPLISPVQRIKYACSEHKDESDLFRIIRDGPIVLHCITFLLLLLFNYFVVIFNTFTESLSFLMTRFQR